MAVIDDLLAKEPEQREVVFCLDRQLREALSTAQVRLQQAQRRLDVLAPSNRDRIRDARAEIDQLEATVAELLPKVKAKLVRFTFAAIDPDKYDDLKAKHPPTDDQLSAARKAKRLEPEFNEDTFAPVLVAAMCVRVETPSGTADHLSLEDAQRLWESPAYNDAERSELFNSALGAQISRTVIDLPKDG